MKIAETDAPGAGATPLPFAATAALPNDPRLADTWALGHVGAFEAWKVSTGAGVTVAVLDTGVDLTHADLAANAWTNPGEVAGDGIDNDGNGFVDDMHGWNFSGSGIATDTGDRHSHGTHVAGLIAAEADNGVGVAGIAPDAEIMAVKVLGDGGMGSGAWIADGIDYAVGMGARIVNMSLGGADPMQNVARAIERARDAGVIVVAAAGNDTADEAEYPAHYSAAYDNVLSVAATTKSGRLAEFSNWSVSRSTVDLAAPGDKMLSTTPGDGYGSRSGTSMAAPLVSGAAALLWGANPGWSYTQVIDAITATVSPVLFTGRDTVTNGILDLSGAAAYGAASLPVNGSPTLQVVERVTSVEEDRALPEDGLLVADLVVTDDGMGSAVLGLTGPDAGSFVIRDGALHLRAEAVLDASVKAELHVTVTVDDPLIGVLPEAEIDFVLTVAEASGDEGADPADFAGLVFAFDTDEQAEDVSLGLTDLSGSGHDAVVSGDGTPVAAAENGGVTFDGDTVYRIANATGLNIAPSYGAKTLSFSLEAGDDVQTRQVVYEQGGGTRGLSVSIEGGAVHVTGWNVKETVWWPKTVSADIAAGQQFSVSLVMDSEAGTLRGYVDGDLAGEATGVELLYRHGNAIGLGGVQGKTRGADGTRAKEGEAGFLGTLHAAAGHNAALSAEDVAALHAGFAADAPAPSGGADAFDFRATLADEGSGILTNAEAIDLAGGSGAYRLDADAAGFDGRVSLSGLPGGERVLVFSDRDGTTATGQLEGVHAAALRGRLGLSVDHVAPDAVRFDVARPDGTDTVLLEGAFVSDLLG